MDESKMHLDWSATSYTSDRKSPQKGSNSGLPRGWLDCSLFEVLSPTVSTFLIKKCPKRIPFLGPSQNSPPRDFAKVWDFNKIDEVS